MHTVLIEQNKQRNTHTREHFPYPTLRETLQLQQLERVIYTAQKKHDLDTVISENKLKVII